MKQKIIVIAVVLLGLWGCTREVKLQRDYISRSFTQVESRVFIVESKYTEEYTDYCVVVFDEWVENPFSAVQNVFSRFQSLNVMAQKEYIEALQHLKQAKWFSTEADARAYIEDMGLGRREEGGE